MVNLKPSRFGPLRELFAAYDHCAEHGIGAYGGGQFELGVGRGQIQSLASIFHPDGPNDVAPGGYNDVEPADGPAVEPARATAGGVGVRVGGLRSYSARPSGCSRISLTRARNLAASAP